MYALSAHLDVDDLHVSETEVLAQKAEEMLRERFSINHTTFQFECRRGLIIDDALRVISSKESEDA
jgi:divalent metal cation (Fe/Co/Zn/Cd) transporter